MLYDVKTPEEYLNTLEDDWRKQKVLQLRQMILSQDTSIKEGIRYKMLSYGDEQGVILQLNAQKNYVSLYVGDASKVDPEGTMLKGIDRGKGCLRMKKSLKIEETGLERFIATTISMWKAGGDIDC